MPIWIGRLEHPMKIFFRTALFFLRVFFAVTIFALRQMVGAMAAWFKATLTACEETSNDYTRKATEAGIGNHSKIVYWFFFLLTFVELVVLTFILAHILVLAVFWIFVL